MVNVSFTPFFTRSSDAMRTIQVDLKYTKGWNATDDRGYSPLHFAAQHSLLENVKLLLSYGAIPDKESTLRGREVRAVLSYIEANLAFLTLASL